MSDDPETPPSLNPYAASPSHPGSIEEEVYTDLRPTGVTVTGVLCLLGGILGVLMGIGVVIQLLIGNQFATAMTPPGASGNVQRQMMSEMQAVSDRFMVATTCSSIGVFLFGCCLLIGGVALFKKRVWVPTWLQCTFFALVVFELARQVLLVFVQLEMMPIMDRFMSQMAKTNGPPGQQAMMGTIQKASMIIGLAFSIGWAVCKIGLLIWGYRYLGKSEVRAYFSANNSIATR